MSKWLTRHLDAPLPFQTWKPFPDDAIVQVRGSGGSTIDLAKNLWWGYVTKAGVVGEGAILYARRLDKPKTKQP